MFFMGNIILRLSFLSFLCVPVALVMGQKDTSGFNKQISFSHDNDFFAFRGTDGYYTSGIFINYSTVKKTNKPGVIKTVYNFEIGQKIFTPGIREVFVITELDRPITGYLYGAFSLTKFKQKSKFLKLGVAAGTIGPAALGKQLLDAIHPLLKINAEFWDWMYDYQLKNQPGINVDGSYGFSVIRQSNPGLFQITPVCNATLGTTFTNIRQSVLLQFGRQNEMHQSGFWNARIESDGTSVPRYKKEVFLYYQPEFMYQVYNATVQGGLFIKDKGGITSKLQPFVLINKFGVMLASQRCSLGFHYTFQSKEAKSQENGHIFGGVQIQWRFR